MNQIAESQAEPRFIPTYEQWVTNHFQTSLEKIGLLLATAIAISSFLWPAHWFYVQSSPPPAWLVINNVRSVFRTSLDQKQLFLYPKRFQFAIKRVDLIGCSPIGKLSPWEIDPHYQCTAAVTSTINGVTRRVDLQYRFDLAPHTGWVMGKSARLFE